MEETPNVNPVPGSKEVTPEDLRANTLKYLARSLQGESFVTRNLDGSVRDFIGPDRSAHPRDPFDPKRPLDDALVLIKVHFED